ncbi:MAG: hypothetical protein C0415_00335 [Thermodesulfovibrio sp.]|nr:hypothetical protein [Thermodesulfovibrio sp.]
MKKPFYIGAAFGGVLGIVTALSMDVLLGQNPGGGWSEAVANDMNRLLKTNFSTNSSIVIAGVIFVIGLIGIFGAFAGGIFGVIIARFFDSLTKEP